MKLLYACFTPLNHQLLCILYTDVKNITFTAGKAENELMKIINSLPDGANIVAVVDPPRAGLHNKVHQQPVLSSSLIYELLMSWLSIRTHSRSTLIGGCT